MERKGTFWKILLTLLILGGLGYGVWYGYNRFFAETPTKEGTVYVQSVTAITGVGPAGTRSRYTGVVEAKNVISVDPDRDLTVKEVFVSAGDKVKKGDPLFSYDVANMEINYEQIQLDILGLENGIQAGHEKVENLTKRLAKAREYQKYDIQMEIRTEELEIRKQEYELSGKQKQAQDMEHALNNSVVYSAVDGTVRAVRSGDSSGQDYYGDGSSQDNAFISIVAGNDYCVRGTVSEQTIHTLQTGMEVRIMSRVDDTVWSGFIYKINTEETKQNNRYYYYYDEGSGDRASKYDFFVELESNEGLLMGQHVYIEPGSVNEEDTDELLLPVYYVVENEGQPFVYAADADGRIEKRTVTLGERDEDSGVVAILSGLSYYDRIAFPDETVQVGMAVSETAYVPEDMGDVYLDDGEEYDGESWDGETDWDGETGEEGEMGDGETGAILGDMDLDEFKLDLGRIRSDDGETDGEGEEPTGGAQG